MAIPEKIGRYVIKSELGRGGMATVYHGYDPSFDREVAIKVLPREMMHDPQFRQRFERELKIVAALEHPAIVPVYDVGDENGQPYFVMRYMTGGSLANEIEKGKFSLQDCARIVGRIAQGLAYAHKKGVVHRDLKPDNILFDDAGDPFISDFGVAKLSESTGSLTGSGIIGTPAYMSPEQAQGVDIDGRSDVYGLGVIVYQMLSGQQPYSADTPMGVVVKHITEPVPEILKTLPSLPIEVDHVIKNAMAKDKTKRYQTTIDLAKALNLIAFGDEGNLTPTNLTGAHPRAAAATTSSRSKTGFAVAGIVVLIVLIGGFLLRNQLFPSQQATATPAPTLTAIQAEAPISTNTSIPFAPACAANVTIPAPEVTETNKECKQKIPYTSIAVSPGATFQSLDPAFSCVFQATVNGKDVIVCTGRQLFSFNLKVCAPPSLSTADLNKCSSDTTYSTAGQCCVAVPPKDAGCTTFKVDIRGCQ